MLFDKLRGLQAYYREGGVYEVIRRLSAYGYLPKSLLFLSSKRVLTLGNPKIPPLKNRLAEYRFEKADRTAIDALIACQGERISTPRAVFEYFFDEGQTCYVARRQGQIVAYFWTFRRNYMMVFGGRKDQALTFALNDNEVFFGNGFIAPAYRLRGLFPGMIQFITAQFPAGTRFLSSVDPVNKSSLLAHTSYGFTRTLDIIFLGALGLKLFYSFNPSSHFTKFLGFSPVKAGLSALCREQRLSAVRVPQTKRLSGKAVE